MTSPLYALVKGDVLLLSWDFMLCAVTAGGQPNVAACRRFIVDGLTLRETTTITGVQLIAGGAHAAWRDGSLAIVGPDRVDEYVESALVPDAEARWRFWN